VYGVQCAGGAGGARCGSGHPGVGGLVARHGTPPIGVDENPDPHGWVAGYLFGLLFLLTMAGPAVAKPASYTITGP
jgi:hypothetical protein